MTERQRLIHQAVAASATYSAIAALVWFVKFCIDNPHFTDAWPSMLKTGLAGLAAFLCLGLLAGMVAFILSGPSFRN